MVVSASHNAQGRTFSLTPEVSSLGSAPWTPLIADKANQSFAYYYDYESSDKDGFEPFASQADLDRWFRELHPSNYGKKMNDGEEGNPNVDEVSWTGSSYKGEVLLRKTAWCVFDQKCECEYG